MKSLTDSIRTTWRCPTSWLVYMLVMGALSPGSESRAELGHHLGLPENSLKPGHWYNNSTPSTLYCRTGYSLQIFPDGKVSGTLSNPVNKKYVNFTFTTADKNTVVIKGVGTALYLCMNALSEVYATKTYVKQDCEWKEIILRNWFNAYQHKHHMRKKSKLLPKKRYYLAFNDDGTMRPGNSSRKSWKSSQFLKNGLSGRSTGPPLPIPTPTRGWITDRPSTGHSILSSTKRPQHPGVGCKGLRTKYCKRIRNRRKNGKSIKHAKRHRKCRPRRMSNDRETLKDLKKLRRLERRCKRIRRKRKQRRFESQKRHEELAKQRTSMLKTLTTPARERT